MARKEYFFQKRKRNIAQKFFEKGLGATSYILLTLHETGKDFLKDLPDCYPAFKLMKDVFGVSYKKYEFKKETIRTDIYRLIKQGLVAKDPKEKICYLTEKGREVITYIENRYSILKKPWDGKLRIVIFDIPEERRYWREIIRKELSVLQFQQLQKSVYVGKYAIPESFCKEIEEAGIGRYIFIFTVDKVDRKEEILKLIEDGK